MFSVLRLLKIDILCPLATVSMFSVPGPLEINIFCPRTIKNQCFTRARRPAGLKTGPRRFLAALLSQVSLLPWIWSTRNFLEPFYSFLEAPEKLLEPSKALWTLKSRIPGQVSGPWVSLHNDFFDFLNQAESVWGCSTKLKKDFGL